MSKYYCVNGHEVNEKTGENFRCPICKQDSMRKFKDRKPLYDIWKGMIRRCTDPSFKDWHLYGGKTPPITVCQRWYDYNTFANDMGSRPSKNHSIERINGNFGYEPGNCKWATPAEQTRNMSRNIFITINNETLAMVDWCAKLNLNYQMVSTRIKRGMNPVLALSLKSGEAPRGRKDPDLITFNGLSLSKKDWAKHLGVEYDALRSRFLRGMSTETALTQPFKRSMRQERLARAKLHQ